MAERENHPPQHDSDARLGALFGNLPEPTAQLPTVDTSAPVPGSRRAAREAAEPRQASPIPPVVSEDPFVTATAPAPVAVAEKQGGRLEDLFDAHHDDIDSHAPPKKRRRGCLIALIIVLVIVGGIAGAGVWAWNTYGDKISDAMGWGEPKDWEPGLATGEVFVTIREGDTGRPVSTALHEAGVTKTEDVFYDYLIEEAIAVTFYPGVYRLQEKMTAEAALAALRDEANKLENTASVIEGSTIKAMLPGIAESIGIPLADFEAAVADPSAYGVTAESLEGWLFPAVYTFDPEVTATQVIQRMVDRTRESLTKAGVQAGDEQRVLTIASIIQREGSTADFDKVSRVIENRLEEGNQETHGLLQMDSTAQYGYGLTHEGPVSSWDWNAVVGDQNPWNTYKHAGLPTGPISAPSDAAIDAAQNPADGPWFYFVTVNLDTGETVFSATYAEQQQAEARYKQWCQDNPDGGCY
ncbi:endolytic transglycosylase MltG [Microbacterium sp. LWH12-1.2]|uniref:endolytic transglycosylase MltG n=1 Tax=Microbacterium sp. LWH12-1.2 TaxID=3135259 RepID=UPI00341A228B